MAVVSVKENFQRRRSQVRDGEPAHTRVFIVITDNVSDGTVGATYATGVPQAYDGHPDNPAWLATDIQTQPINNSAFHFEVQIEYTVAKPLDPNPLNRPPELSWSYAEQTEPYFIDQSDTPQLVVNSAGDPFENFLERETGRLQISYSRNEASYDAAAMDVYAHTVNLAAITLGGTEYDVGTLKMSPVTASEVTETINSVPITYYKVNYVFKARHEGWHDKPLDAGYNELIPQPSNGSGPVPPVLRPIVDSTGCPIKKPAPLDGNGRKVADPTASTYTPSQLDFKPYKDMDWSGLRFT